MNDEKHFFLRNKSKSEFDNWVNNVLQYPQYLNTFNNNGFHTTRDLNDVFQHDHEGKIEKIVKKCELEIDSQKHQQALQKNIRLFFCDKNIFYEILRNNGLQRYTAVFTLIVKINVNHNVNCEHTLNLCLNYCTYIRVFIKKNSCNAVAKSC